MLDEFPHIKGMPFDVRAEVLAMLIARRFGLSTEQVLYNPACWHQRPGRRDVVDLSEDFSHRLEKKLLVIETSREGMFDALPEALFLHPEEEYGTNLRKVQALSEQEAQARKFLLPFEQLFFWMRLENEMNTWSLEEELHDWWNRRLPPRQSEELDEHQRTVVQEMLPYAQEITGNWPLTEQWLSLFTGHKVRIREEDFPEYDLPPELRKRMGEARLGRDMVLGDAFVDGIPAVRITFEDLEPRELAGLLPEGPARAFVEDHFLQYLLPVEIPVFIDLESKTNGDPFTLEAENASNVLGYTTHL